MLRRKILALFALTGASTLAACAPQTVYVPQPVAVAPQPMVRGCDTRFQVVNQSSLTVMELRFSHAGLNTWGPDRLGANVLPPGRVWNDSGDHAGLTDFRVVYANGRAAELRRVDVCRISQVVVTNSGLFAR